MTDDEFRDLERRWSADGDPTTEAHVLAARLRAGTLQQERLEIAAYVGHGPAQETLGRHAPAGNHPPWSRWRAAIDESSRVSFVRLAVVLAEQMLEVSDRRLLSPEVDAAVPAARAWLECPCVRHARQARSAGRRIRAEMTAPSRVTRRLLFAIGAAVRSGPGWAVRDEQRDLADLALAAVGEVHASSALDERPRAARDGVVRWALGPAHAFVPGSQPDEPSYLAARLERGELTQERIEVAAYAGASAARRVLGLQHDSSWEPEDLVEWALGLVRWNAGWLFLVLADSVISGNPDDEANEGLVDRRPTGRERRALLAARDALRDWATQGTGGLAEALAELEQLEPEAPRADGTFSFRGRLTSVLEGLVHSRLPSPEVVRRVVRSGVGHPLVRWSDVAAWALKQDEPHLLPAQRVSAALE